MNGQGQRAWVERSLKSAVPLYVLLLVAIVALFVIGAVFTRPAPIPRIVDEHGNNLVYTCPGDPRCTPTAKP